MSEIYKRTHMCGELRLADEGKEVILNGWVAKQRSLGSLVFVDLRDKTGITQITFNEDIPEWNRFRTTNVLVYAHLSEQNLFSSCSYKEVASSIRNTVHSVALLDRTNAVYGQTAIINTGTETARESKKVPVFVPVSYSDGEKDNRQYGSFSFYYFRNDTICNKKRLQIS